MSTPEDKVAFAELIEEHIAWCPPAGAVALSAGATAIAAAQEVPIIRESSIVKRLSLLAGTALIATGAGVLAHYLRMHQHANNLYARAQEQSLEPEQPIS